MRLSRNLILYPTAAYSFPSIRVKFRNTALNRSARQTNQSIKMGNFRDVNRNGMKNPASELESSVALEARPSALKTVYLSIVPVTGSSWRLNFASSWRAGAKFSRFFKRLFDNFPARSQIVILSEVGEN